MRTKCFFPPPLPLKDLQAYVGSSVWTLTVCVQPWIQRHTGLRGTRETYDGWTVGVTRFDVWGTGTPRMQDHTPVSPCCFVYLGVTTLLSPPAIHCVSLPQPNPLSLPTRCPRDYRHRSLPERLVYFGLVSGLVPFPSFGTPTDPPSRKGPRPSRLRLGEHPRLVTRPSFPGLSGPSCRGTPSLHHPPLHPGSCPLSVESFLGYVSIS